MNLCLTENLNITLSATIITGIVIFVAQNVLLKLCIEPIHALAQTRGRIADHLLVYTKVYSNPGSEHAKNVDKSDEVSLKAERLGAELISRAALIPAYDLFAGLRFVPNYSALEIARQELTWLHNNIQEGTAVKNAASKQRLKVALKLK